MFIVGIACQIFIVYVAWKAGWGAYAIIPLAVAHIFLFAFSRLYTAPSFGMCSLIFLAAIIVNLYMINKPRVLKTS
jgi:hypothetical protein